MNIPLDESLQSFLLRQQLVFADVFDPKGVVSGDGRWFSKPYAHHEVSYVFHRFDDLFLLETSDIGKKIGRMGHGLFDTPSAYCHNLPSIFLSGERSITYKSDKKIRIKFCQKCITQAIIDFGFGYFKHDWIQARRCHEHNTPLYRLQLTSYNNALINIKQVMNGELPRNAVEIVDSYQRNNPTFAEHSISRPEFIFPIRAMKCVGEVIGVIILNNIRKLPSFDGLFDIKAWLLLGEDLLLWGKDNLRFMKATLAVENAIVLLSKCDDFNYELQQAVEYVKVIISPRKQFSEIIMVPKFRYCASCLECRTCAAVGEDTENIRDKVDLHFLFQHSTSFKRYVFDNNIILLTGNHVWSPFRVKRDILNEKSA